MATKEVAIRLKPTGEADVKRAYADIGAAAKASAAEAEAASSRAGAAAEREINRLLAAASKAKAKALADANQAAINSAVGVQVRGAGAGSARQSAAVFEDAFRQQDAMAAKAAALKAQLDPLGAAQARYDAELKEYRGLAEAGAISTDEFSRAQALAKRRLDETARSLGATTKGLGLSRQGFQTLVYTISDVISSAASGINPMRMLAQQGPQVAQSFLLEATAGRAAAAGIAETGAAAGASALPMLAMVGIVGGVVVALGAGAAAALAYEGAQKKLEVVTRGLGAATGETAGHLEAIAERVGDAGDVSVSAARKIESAYVSTGKIGGEVLERLTGATAAYAALTLQDVPSATDVLAKAFADPAKGAELLNQQLAFLSPRELEHIRNLADAGDRTAAQKALVEALIPRLGSAADATTGWAHAMHGLATAAANAWDWLGRVIDRMVTGGDLATRAASAAARAAAYERMDPNSVMAKNARAEAERLKNEALGQNSASSAAAAAAARNQAGDDFRSHLSSVDANFSRRQQLTGDIAYLKNVKAGRVALPDGYTLDDVDKGIADAEKALKALGGHHKGGGHAAALARQTASLDESAKGAWALADAYLATDAAALKAEAARKALTQAARNGADADLRVRQQLEIAVAEQAMAGAKQVADLRVHTEAQKAANDAVASGRMTLAQANQQMETDLALRPLIAAADVAEGANKAKLLDIIKKLTAARAEDRREADRARLLAANQNQRDELEQLRLEHDLIGATNQERERALALAQALKDLRDDQSGDLIEKGLHIVQALTNADQRALNAHDAYFDKAKRDDADQLEMLQAQISLMGDREEIQQRELALIAKRQELLRAGYSLDDPAVQAELERTKKIEDAKVYQTERQGVMQAWGEGARAALDGNFWDFVKSKLREAWYNAAVNAAEKAGAMFFDWVMKSGQGGQGGGQSGGGGFMSLLAQGVKFLFGGHAMGTSNFAGGWTWVGEAGKELVRLPAGSRIYSHADSMAGASGFGLRAMPAPVFQIHTTVNANNAVTAREMYAAIALAHQDAVAKGHELFRSTYAAIQSSDSLLAR